ncbi:extracellular catalytic domain type 1 short-chain-length polyhydroxyalkanoate depolymerase [Thauera butanivorans]|uniref:extracellular catalytic domain type 1 short-chain-length polyhydroxyalkanoate depolymerase n=1 Tax=Thauera butanivorans TaxID=86174 RepID=UPI000838BD76|nr:PHB depolymerase family esterase [Thauera butanivorans]
MSRRLRKSPLARALQRATAATTAMTRKSLAAGTRAVGKAVAQTVDAIAAPHRPPPGAGDWIAGQALGPAGVRRFHLFRPPGIRHDERRPLLVMLHGCGQTAAQFAHSTRMNRIARRERLLVLYPEQDRSANPQGCWNWYDTRSRHADAEAETLMAAIDQVCLLYPVDREAIALAGISAGASMAALLAARHPDRFAAVAMHCGVPPGSAHSAATALAAMGGRRTAKADLAPDGGLPPLLVIHGQADRVVAPANGRAAAELWAAASGARAGEPRRMQRGVRRPMTVTDYRAGRRLAAQLVEVEGLGHAWSGGDARQLFSDPQGPDASGMVWRFVAASLKRRAATQA